MSAQQPPLRLVPPRPPAAEGLCPHCGCCAIEDQLDGVRCGGGCHRCLVASPAPPVTGAERAALDRLEHEVSLWWADVDNGLAAVARPLVFDLESLLALARRAGAADTPRDHAGEEGTDGP